MKYALVTDSNDFVVGYWSGEGPGVPASKPGATVHPVSKVDYLAYANATRFDGSSQQRWVYTQGGGLVEQADTRPLTRWIADPDGTPESTSNGPVEYTLDVGDPPGKVRVEVIDEQGNVRTQVNVTRRVRLGPYIKKVSVTAGVAEINVPTGTSREVVIRSNQDFRLENDLTVVVADTEL